jgi:site-specific DNA-cytosine methylase
MIGRADKNGPQGDGVNKDVSFTLNTTDRHAVCSSVGGFMQAETERTPTLMARDCKDPHVICRNQEGVVYGQAKKTNTREILQLLQQEIGEKDLSEWGFRVLAALQSQKILRQEMYGKVILQTRNGIKVLGHDTLEGKAEEVTRQMRDLSEAECKRCSPQRRKPSEQLTREFATYMSELSQQDSPKEKFVQDMWEAGQGAWILREALPEIQKIWESICVQKKSTYAIGSVRRLTAKECCRLQGYPDGYTNIPGASDSARYKALGNSFAIPNIKFVLDAIARYNA